jgi:hypothetical protein
MAGLLARCPRLKMLVEFWPAGLARSGYGAERLFGLLQALGFQVYEIDEVEYCVRRADPPRLLDRYPASGKGSPTCRAPRLRLVGSRRVGCRERLGGLLRHYHRRLLEIDSDRVAPRRQRTAGERDRTRRYRRDRLPSPLRAIPTGTSPPTNL